MNSMNATAVTFAGVSNEGSSRNKALKSLEILSKSEPGRVKRRKRTSAIESQSDLLLDPYKDVLLRTSNNRCTASILGDGLFSMEEIRYRLSNDTLRYFYDKKGTFKMALELFNRIHCVYDNGTWRSHGYFFECKGPIRVVQRMCTRCRDCDKPKTRTDLYYVDIAEKHRERTVYCHGCMGRVLQQDVGTNEARMEKQLSKLRRQQKAGIYIFSRGNK